MFNVYNMCQFCFIFFFKQKTAYEMRISDWSSDVCSSDLLDGAPVALHGDHSGDQAVEEVTIVADEDEGAFVVVQHLFQQVEGLHIEIVGRLVQHQQVADRKSVV